MNEINAKKIGNALGKFMDVDVDPQFGIACKKSLRIKVEIDITKPLKIGFWLPRDYNIDTWVSLKFEHLLDFCYACGRIGHSQVFCTFLKDIRNPLPYRPWLRAEFQNSSSYIPPHQSQAIIPSFLQLENSSTSENPMHQSGMNKKNESMILDIPNPIISNPLLTNQSYILGGNEENTHWLKMKLEEMKKEAKLKKGKELMIEDQNMLVDDGSWMQLQGKIKKVTSTPIRVHSPRDLITYTQDTSKKSGKKGISINTRKELQVNSAQSLSLRMNMTEKQ